LPPFSGDRAERIASIELALDCLYESVNKREGYDANLCQIEYSCCYYQETGITLRFSGYRSALKVFVDTFVTMLLTQEGLDDDALIEVSREKMYKEYVNSNTDVYERCDHNRLVHLIQSKVHVKLLEKCLETYKGYPSKTLKECLQNVFYIRALAYGDVDMESVERIAQKLAPKKVVSTRVNQQISKVTQFSRWDYQVAGKPIEEHESMEDGEEEQEEDQAMDS
jgi:secreted Zn-dependent insulinase-like peptidase